jgi:hypothetical protein
VLAKRVAAKAAGAAGMLQGEFVTHLEDNTFETMGVVHTLALLFKHGHREKFLVYVDEFMEHIILIAENTSSQTLLRKLLVKLFQRIGTTFMPVRVVPWRYQRGRRSLLQNMETAGDGSSAAAASPDALPPPPSGVVAEPEIHVPPELEDVVDQLLTGLRDRDTVVRWSAAKGLGRITERLPRECADDVVGAILEVSARFAASEARTSELVSGFRRLLKILLAIQGSSHERTC